ncbi:MAG: 16S rRNA (cytosine(1402)-N(4))-methyltransferase RsmH, partial [Gemmatimonadaceae bacterium]|nr:16S rRNA (cytosine(1402)-N(4))-methyltransferase RsmH [Gemmatimonadaceae bacterium]
MTSPAAPPAFHEPVLVREVAQLLGNARHVLDCTLGGGGHARALLAQGARVTGLDQDPAAIRAAVSQLAHWVDRGAFTAVQANFADVDQRPGLADAAWDGILLDLGVSSHQLDEEARGFTFRAGAPLDMRMRPDAPLDAARLLNESSEHELIRIFREHADEPRSGRLAREIVRRRATRPFRVSDDLVGAIRAVLGPRSGPAQFAPIFQAVRIAVNDEIGILQRSLPALRDRLTPGGVMAVIAYHSGEDRLVKHAFADWSAACVCPPKQPVCTCRGAPLGATVTRKPVRASAAE